MWKKKVIKLCIVCFCILGYFYRSAHIADRSQPTQPQTSAKNNIHEHQTGQNPIKKVAPKEKLQEDKFEKVQLSVPQSIQENNYFCVPACLQMVLRYHGIEKSQSQLANELKTSPKTGTEYIDLAQVANNYLTNDDDTASSPTRYHVQTLKRYDTNPDIVRTFKTSVKTAIYHHTPVFIAVDLHALYPDLPSANHIILCTGYRNDKETEETTYYYIEPYYGVQDQTYKGLKIVADDVLIHAILANDEPAYIW